MKLQAGVWDDQFSWGAKGHVVPKPWYLFITFKLRTMGEGQWVSGNSNGDQSGLEDQTSLQGRGKDKDETGGNEETTVSPGASRSPAGLNCAL